MKRYKNCSLYCTENQDFQSLLDLVGQVSITKGYKVERFSSFNNNDSLAVYLREPKLPHSRLIICADIEKQTLPIVNIVPMPDSKISHIGYSEYNQLLDSFRKKVYDIIREQYGNRISETTEDYTIEDIIPLSFKALNDWLNASPLSRHPLDEKNWNHFVITLHENKEHLSIQDFEYYVREKYGWNDEDIDTFSLKLESELELLEYYDNYRKI